MSWPVLSVTIFLPLVGALFLIASFLERRTGNFKGR
jgi:hypothetical protein